MPEYESPYDSFTPMPFLLPPGTQLPVDSAGRCLLRLRFPSTHNLRSSDGGAGASTTLPGVQSETFGDMGTLLDNLLTFGKDQFDVARVLYRYN